MTLIFHYLRSKIQVISIKESH